MARFKLARSPLWSIAITVISIVAIVVAVRLLWSVLISTDFLTTLLLRADWQNQDPAFVAEAVRNIQLTLFSSLDWSALCAAGFAILWHVICALRTIDEPAKAPQLWYVWFILLAVGLLLAGGANWYAYFELAESEGLEPQRKFLLSAGATVLFVLLYWIGGTLFATRPIVRPAVPLGRWLA